MQLEDLQLAEVGVGWGGVQLDQGIRQAGPRVVMAPLLAFPRTEGQVLLWTLAW